MCKSTLICFLFVAFAITVEVTSVTFYDSFEDAQTWKSSAFLGIGLVLFMFYLWVTCSLLQFIKHVEDILLVLRVREIEAGE